MTGLPLLHTNGSIYYRLPEVAEHLGVTSETICRYVRNRRLKAVKRRNTYWVEVLGLLKIANENLERKFNLQVDEIIRQVRGG